MIASYMHKNDPLMNSTMKLNCLLNFNSFKEKMHKVVFYISHPCLIIEQWSCLLFITHYVYLFITYFQRRKNIMSYNFKGLFLIVTNFFCNILIKLQKYYITSLLGKIFCFADKYVLHMFYLITQMGTLIDNLPEKVINFNCNSNCNIHFWWCLCLLTTLGNEYHT